MTYGDNKNTLTETEYGEIMEEPHPIFCDIGIFDKYIAVTLKLDKETNSGGKFAY